MNPLAHGIQFHVLDKQSHQHTFSITIQWCALISNIKTSPKSTDRTRHLTLIYTGNTANILQQDQTMSYTDRDKQRYIQSPIGACLRQQNEPIIMYLPTRRICVCMAATS